MTDPSPPVDCFSRLVRRVGPAMLGYARRRTDPETAEDVVAEALLVLWRRRGELLTDGSGDRTGGVDDEVAYAVAITRRCLANARRGARRRRLLERRLSDLEPRLPAAPDAAAVDADLHAALESLRAADRELLRLWAWDDLRPAQIAVVLGSTPQAVSVRLHRAKKRLGAALDMHSDRRPSTITPPSGSLP